MNAAITIDVILARTLGPIKCNTRNNNIPDKFSSYLKLELSQHLETLIIFNNPAA